MELSLNVLFVSLYRHHPIEFLLSTPLNKLGMCIYYLAWDDMFKEDLQ